MNKEEIKGWLGYFAGDEWNPPEGRAGLVFGIQALRRAMMVIDKYYNESEVESIIEAQDK